MVTADTPFLVGANLPWLQYGCDFGANAWQPDGGVACAGRAERLDRALAGLAAQGVSTLRWFLLCDGRAGVRFGEDGLAAGLDRAFWLDFDAGLDAVRRHRLAVVFVLFDFWWWRRRRTVKAVTCGGHRRAAAPGVGRSALIERVLAPILDRFGREPAIAAWDIVNEPEWVTFGYGSANPLTAVTPAAMRGFITECVSAVHAGARQPATVGLASWRGLPLVTGADLDIYQVHWYDRLERWSPLASPLVRLLDRPVWLGEFPTADSVRSVPEILETARSAGYAAALAWPVASGDRP